jgi:hypothetical protein
MAPPGLTPWEMVAPLSFAPEVMMASVSLAPAPGCRWHLNFTPGEMIVTLSSTLRGDDGIF